MFETELRKDIAEIVTDAIYSDSDTTMINAIYNEQNQIIYYEFFYTLIAIKRINVPKTKIILQYTLFINEQTIAIKFNDK